MGCKKMIWDQLTSRQLGSLDSAIPVILPVSATEQHGPHLPLATDRMIGEHFCRKIDAEIKDKVLILPSVSVGCSWHHMDFAGTLSVKHDTFIRQVEDILSTVAHHGFVNMIIFNSHGGNIAVGQLLMEKLGTKFSKGHIVMVTWWKLISEVLFDLDESGPGGVGHAGEFETSLMMHIAPELVHHELIEEVKNIKSFDWAETDMLRGSKASLYRSMKEMTSNGAFGDPSAASEEKGRKIAELVTSAMKKIISDLHKVEKKRD